MTDFDSALRTMLQTRAQDITTVPPSISRFDADGDARHIAVRSYTEGPQQRPRRTGWLVAASVLAILAVVAIVIAAGRNGGQHSPPPATNVPSPAPSTSTSTSTSTSVAHIASRVSLSWFAMANLPGYTAHERHALPGYQSLALRRDSDTGTPIGCNGCESASVYVYMFDAGRFDASKNGVSGGQPVTVGGKPAQLGTAPWYGAPKQRVPSIAWQFRPGEWVLVQGVTAVGGSRQALLTVADAVRPTRSVPIGLPCRFDYLPPMPIVDVFDDRSEGYAFVLTMSGTGGRSFTITLWKGAGWTYYDPTGMTRQTIGGRPGYYGRQQGAGVLYHGGGMALGFGENDGSNGGKLTAADDAQTRQVIAGIHWAGGDGRQSVAAEDALP